MKLTETEKNTNLFYKELNNNCDPEILLEIAKKGIFLYSSLYKKEKIKNHNYVIDISILARQYFMINTKQQYIHFFEILKNNFKEYNLYSFYHCEIDCCDLIIINKIFIELLMDEKDPYITKFFCTGDSNLLLRYLEKYNIISYNTLTLISYNEFNDDDKFEFLNFFYFDEENHIYNNSLFFNFNDYTNIINVISSIGYDISMLKYCANLSKNFNILIPTQFCRGRQIPLNFPLKILKKYSNKLYTPNKCVFKHPNKYFEDLINVRLTEDELLHYIKRPEEIVHGICGTEELKRYEIDINRIDQSQNKISTDINVDIPVYFNRVPWFKQKNYKIFNSKSPILFSKYVLKDNEKINLLLQDPNYIFTLNVNYRKEILSIKICYIISLIHNNYSHFFIKYIISLVRVGGYSLYFYNNKLNIQIGYDHDPYSPYWVDTVMENLREVPNDTFQKYLCFKYYDGTEIKRNMNKKQNIESENNAIEIEDEEATEEDIYLLLKYN